ncbi:MAG: BamA/TamA family outer membrane protein, partial [Muribaculaceae bacterium]|nr:BamA/TamA family outer membrane protein [Muribaculaceae bacterium]
WHANKQSLNELTPFKLTYSKLMNTSPEFDSVMVVNPALALSFSNTFIPQMSYTYTYDNKIGPNNYTWTSTIIEAGNIFAGIWELAGNKGTKKLFGTPFSQFVKAQTQFVWTRDLSTSSQLATRVFVGAAHAYGNSEQVPFSEQFYVGGANSIRAFTVRTIGPGSSRTVGRIYKGYYDQTGTFKFEFNTEYRFGLLGSLKGALFLDAGNVWLLKEDENRPGGKLKMKNFFDEIAWGVGVGLRFDMGMLVIRGDLGIPVHVPFETSHHRYFNIDSDSDVGPTFHLAIGYPF